MNQLDVSEHPDLEPPSHGGVRKKALKEPPVEHRRRTARSARHAARSQLKRVVADEEALEDADLRCPLPGHDLGRKTGRAPRKSKEGRRRGFKVWKTPFWKRRRALRARRYSAERDLAEQAD